MGLLKRMVTVVVSLALLASPTSSRPRRHAHSRGQEEPEVCVMPPSSELERRLAFPMDLHGTFYQFPPLQDSVMTLEKFQKENPNMTERRYSYINGGSVECRSKEEQSTPAWDPCPVLWKFNHDQNRIPETLVEAECLQCQMCQDLDAEDLGIGCGPVHYLTKVLRRKSSCDSLTGHYIYVEVWEPVTVGCACRGGVRTRPSGSKGVVVRSDQQK